MRDHFIWKYNTVVHMATRHPEEKIPLDLLSRTLKETELMKVGLGQTEFYWETRCNEFR